jgi:DnaJ-class molecular chaperone
MNDNVVRLETKCPECDGKGNVEYFDSGYCANMVTMCKRCIGAQSAIWVGVSREWPSTSSAHRCERTATGRGSVPYE